MTRDITMYGADWCGDCRRAKAWFDTRDIDYRYVDLVEQEEAVEVVLAHIRSEDPDARQRIPVVVFGDGSFLVEPSDDELAAKVDELSTRGVAIADNPAAHRFELTRDDGALLSFADYRERDGVLVVPHVETIPEHRGQNNAARLLEGMLAQLRADDRRITPVCSWARAHISANARLHDLVAP